MELVVLVLIVAVVGLVVGLLARLAVPGPDPIGIWRTIVLGILGSLLGGIVAAALGLAEGGGILLAVVGATVLLVLYRRFVQGRTVTGPRSRIRR